jgi:hypothetical protein
MSDVEEHMKDGGRAGDVDARTGQPIEEAEKNLSRHANADSSPPVEEQWRTTVEADNESREQGEE